MAKITYRSILSAIRTGVTQGARIETAGLLVQGAATAGEAVRAVESEAKALAVKPSSDPAIEAIRVAARRNGAAAVTTAAGEHGIAADNDRRDAVRTAAVTAGEAFRVASLPAKVAKAGKAGKASGVAQG